MKILDHYMKEQKAIRKKEDIRYFAGILNKILLFPFLLVLGFWNEIIDFKCPGYIWIVIFGLSPIISCLAISLTISNHDFFEWDKKERKKKKDFIQILTFQITLYTYISVFLLSHVLYEFSLIKIEVLNDAELFILFVRCFYGILFLLNVLFNVYLNYSSYKEFLEYYNYEIAEKPKNWDWERTSADDISDFNNPRF